MQNRPFVIHLLFSFSESLGRQGGGPTANQDFTGNMFLCLLPHCAKNSKQAFIGNFNVQSLFVVCGGKSTGVDEVWSEVLTPMK